MNRSLSTLVVFSPAFSLTVKVSLLPSNTLSGTIWSWTMNIAYMTTGKTVLPDPLCPSEHCCQGKITNTGELVRAVTDRKHLKNFLWKFSVIWRCTLKAFLLWWWLTYNSLQHAVDEPDMWHWVRQTAYLENLPYPLLSVYEMQNSSFSALLAADGGIVMNVCHLIFHMNSLWWDLVRLPYHTLQHAF